MKNFITILFAIAFLTGCALFTTTWLTLGFYAGFGIVYWIKDDQRNAVKRAAGL